MDKKIRKMCWEPSYNRTHSFFTGHQNVNKPMSRIVKDSLWTHIFTLLCIIRFFSFPCYFSKSYLYSNLGRDIQRLPWWEHHENTFYWYIFFLMIVLLSTDYVLNVYIILHHTFYWVKIDDRINSSTY